MVLRSVFIALALLAAACTGTDVSSGSSEADGSTAAAVDNGGGVSSGEVLEAGDVATRDLAYRCDSVVFTPADAVAGTVETAAGTSVIVPLDTPLPSWMVGVEPDGLVPCLAINATVTDLRPVAFAVLGDAVAIEACVSPDDAVVDRREVDGQTVLTVFGPQFEDPTAVAGPECTIDPDNVLDGDAVGEVSAQTRSGVTYPFAVPSAALHEQLGFGIALAPLPPTDPGAVQCRAQPGLSAAEVAWTGLEPGYRAVVRIGDRILYTSEPAGADGAPSIMGAYILALFDRGVTRVAPDFVNSFADYTATGEAQTYVVDVIGGSGSASTIVCGEAGIVGEGTVPLLDPAEQTNTLGGDLGAGKSLFDAVALLPFVYMTIVPTCDGCPGASLDLMLSPEGIDTRVFTPPVEQQADPSLPGLVDPFALHELLAAAEANGRDVSYVLDPSSGVPIEWSIDGRGARITCLEVDIAPPDLRVSDGCRTDLDVIGR